MKSNYLWRSKWENQWWALVGKEEFRRAAGDCPWGNLCDKWLDVHAHVSILYEGTGFCAAAAFFQDFLTLHFHFLLAALSLSLCPEAKCPVAFPGGSSFSIISFSVCLCTFSLFFGCQDWEISYSVRLKSSHIADKSCAEGAPSPRSSVRFLRLGLYLSTFLFPLLFLLLFLCTLPTYLPKPPQL